MRITQLGTGNALVVEDSSNPDSTPFVIDATGHVGLGATPSAWGSSLDVIQTNNGTFYSLSSGTGIVSSGYFDGTNWKYTQASPLYGISINTDSVTWSNAPTGTIGATVTFAERMRIDSSGNVGIGTSSPSTPLHVRGAQPQATITGNTGAAAQLRFYNNAASANDFLIGQGYNTGSDNVAFISNQANADLLFRTNSAERGRFDTSGNFLFNSGYGSVATAYGCRAWINFNGTGTIAIRNSGGVTSIADNGTGLYTVNLSFTMPDVNYAITLTGGNGANTETVASVRDNPTTSSFAIRTATDAGTASDRLYVYAALFR